MFRFIFGVGAVVFGVSTAHAGFFTNYNFESISGLSSKTAGTDRFAADEYNKILSILQNFSTNKGELGGKWSASGSNIYYNDGNVGIGTTNPSEKLEINGNIKASGDFYIKDNTDGNRFYFGTDTYVANPGANNIRLYTNANERLRIDSTGNVGIGTTAPSAKLDLSAGNLDIDSTTNANPYGIITKDGTRFIHNFNYGNNGTVTTDGYNTFIGENAGNLTMGSTATQTYHASRNTAQGMNALYSNTTGSENSAQGMSALQSNTTGNYNSAQGVNALYSNTTGYQNSAQGMNVLYSNTTGYYNSAQGQATLYSNTTGYYNSAQGVQALFSNTTGYYNSAQGVNAGRFIADGATANQTSNTSLYLGAETKALANGDTNEIVVGYNATGNGSNSATIGNDSITKTILKGNIGIGTTNPGEKLDVAGNIRVPDGYGLKFGNSGTTGLYGNGTNNQFSFYTNGVQRMLVDNGGNIGIGTTSPSEKFEVSGAIKIASTSSTCDATHVGTIRYNAAGVDFQGCAETAAGSGIYTWRSLTGVLQ